jgi:hypothetical protein
VDVAQRGEGEGPGVSGRLARAVCPKCGHTSLKVEMRMRAKELGTFSLAGQQLKVSVQTLPYLFCWHPECGEFGVWGWVDGDQVVFPEGDVVVREPDGPDRVGPVD